jgi:hypothetical protein
MLVFGEKQKFAAALIHPTSTLTTYCKNHKIPYITPSEIVEIRFIDRYKRE